MKKLHDRSKLSLFACLAAVVFITFFTTGCDNSPVFDFSSQSAMAESMEEVMDYTLQKCQPMIDKEFRGEPFTEEEKAFRLDIKYMQYLIQKSDKALFREWDGMTANEILVYCNERRVLEDRRVDVIREFYQKHYEPFEKTPKYNMSQDELVAFNAALFMVRIYEFNYRTPEDLLRYDRMIMQSPEKFFELAKDEVRKYMAKHDEIVEYQKAKKLNRFDGDTGKALTSIYENNDYKSTELLQINLLDKWNGMSAEEIVDEQTNWIKELEN